LQPIELLRDCFGVKKGKEGKGKQDSDQKLREDAAAYQNNIEGYIANNDR